MVFLVQGTDGENIEKKEENRPKKNIQKWKERKTKNTGEITTINIFGSYFHI